MINYQDEADRIFDDAYAHATDYQLLDLYRIVQASNRHICAFGTGKVFADNVHSLGKKFGRKIDYACDNNPARWGQMLFGVKCLSYDELLAIKDNVIIVITALEHWVSIARQLQNDGFKYVFPLWRWIYGNSALFNNPAWLLDAKPQFQKMLEILHDDDSRVVALNVLRNRLSRDILSIDFTSVTSSDTEYFPHDIIRLGDSECFVDAGAFDGDTLFCFLKQCNNSFEHSYHLELDPRNYILLQENVASLPHDINARITVYPFGIWNDNQSVSFSGDGISTTITDFSGSSFTGVVKKLDDILGQKKITMIKMDIEGAETNALLGAKKIIETQHPKLAICVYHHLDHLWGIPLLIKELFSGYQLHLRHYTAAEFGSTVCYAIPGK